MDDTDIPAAQGRHGQLDPDGHKLLKALCSPWFTWTSALFWGSVALGDSLHALPWIIDLAAIVWCALALVELVALGFRRLRLTLARWQKITLGLALVCALGMRGAGFLLDRFRADLTSTQVTATTASPDGAYIATVTDWDAGGIGGAGSVLEVRPCDPSTPAALLARLFTGSYEDGFEQITGVRWTGRRTLRVEYWAVPGEDGHAASWGNVRLSYHPVPPG